MYFITASAVPIIKVVLKIFYQMTDVEARKFGVMMTSLLLTLKHTTYQKYLLSEAHFCLMYVYSTNKLQIFLSH